MCVFPLLDNKFLQVRGSLILSFEAYTTTVEQGGHVIGGFFTDPRDWDNHRGTV